jgi:uncharacterized protein (TIGR02453 family)
MKVSQELFKFLSDLSENNNREWFADHKSEFDQLKNDSKQFFESIEEGLNKHDDIEKLKIFRIYRDVRFSKDKTPYKTNFGASFTRRGAHLRGGYYIHLQPNESFLSTGFCAPNKEDLFRIRKEIELDAQELRDILEQEDLKNIWGPISGEALKTAPKGFDKTHPDIDLIRMKQFVFVKKFTDKAVLSSEFTHQIDEAFKAIRPYFDFMSDILTTNLNGESILK